MPEDNFRAFWSGLFAQTPQEFVNAFNLFVGAEQCIPLQLLH